jgi:hypothetical protein
MSWTKPLTRATPHAGCLSIANHHAGLPIAYLAGLEKSLSVSFFRATRSLLLFA